MLDTIPYADLLAIYTAIAERLSLVGRKQPSSIYDFLPTWTSNERQLATN